MVGGVWGCPLKIFNIISIFVVAIELLFLYSKMVDNNPMKEASTLKPYLDANCTGNWFQFIVIFIDEINKSIAHDYNDNFPCRKNIMHITGCSKKRKREKFKINYSRINVVFFFLFIRRWRFTLSLSNHTLFTILNLIFFNFH